MVVYSEFNVYSTYLDLDDGLVRVSENLLKIWRKIKSLE